MSKEGIWLFSLLIGAMLSLGTYVGATVLPAIASLEARAAHVQHDTDAVAKQLELIRKELNAVNVKLARIEAKL